MSSQSVNGTTYSGFTASGSIPARDASDITRQIKERLIYTTLNPSNSATFAPERSSQLWYNYANSTRVTYEFGRLKCGSCSSGNPFVGVSGPVG
jgi:hypothetical protein